jgi:sugar O-acyltransferase (sialic acid O-acetyltransferase NeuD family)
MRRWRSLMEEIKEIIIVGAGGFGRELYSYILDDFAKGFLKGYRFKGFIDDSPENFKASKIEADYLGTTESYTFKESDRVIVPIGNIQVRNRIIEKLQNKGAHFLSYIHHSAFIAHDATLGEGVLICPNCMVQSQSQIGDHAVLNIFCSVGHDSTLGENSILSPYCTLNGNVHTGKNLFMGTRSTLLLGSRIGKNCMIGAHSVVKGKKADNLILKNRWETVEVKNRFIEEL